MFSAKKIFSKKKPSSESSLGVLKKQSIASAGQLLVDIFTADGYEVESPYQLEDGSMMLSKFGEKMIVDWKQWAQKNVDFKKVDQLTQVMAQQKADAYLMVTTGNFSPEISSFAGNKPIVLIDGEILMHWVRNRKLDPEKSAEKTERKSEARSSVEPAKTRSNPSEEIFRQIQAAKSLSDTLNTAIAKLKKMLNAEFVAFFNLEPEERKLYSMKLGDIVTKDEVFLEISRTSLAGFVAATGKPILLENTEEIGRSYTGLKLDPWWYPNLEFKVKSVLALPLVEKNKVIGVVEFLRKEGQFTEKDLKLAKDNTPGMSLAVLKMNLENKSTRDDRKKVNLEDKVNALSQSILSVDNIDTILLEHKNSILEVFNATLLTIYSVDMGKNEIFSKVKSGEGINEIRIPISPQSLAGCAAFLKRPLHIKDAYDKEELINIHEDLSFNNSWDEKTGFRTRSMLVYPLIHENKLQGILQLVNKKSGEDFDKEDEKHAQIIADTLALGFSKMYKEDKARDIIQTIHSAVNLDEILLDLKPSLLELFDAEVITLYAFDSENDQIYSRLKTGDDLKDLRLPIDTESIAGTIAVLKQSVNIKDVYDDKELQNVHADLTFNRSWDEQTGFRTRSMLVYPLENEGQLQGVLQIINKKNNENGFGLTDEKYAKMISGALALGFKNMYREEKIRAINQAIHSAPNLDSILISLKKYLLELFDATLVTVYSVDANTNEIFSKFKTGKLVKEIRVDISPKTIAGAVASLMQPANIKDINDPNEVRCLHPTTSYDNSWDKKSGMELKSMLVYPLIFQDKLMGVLQLINKKDKEMFESLDMKNAAIVSDSLALALHNQKKYDKEALERFGFSTND